MSLLRASLLLLSLSTFAFPQTPKVKLTKVAANVYAALRTEPPGLTVNANSVFIINETDVVVVDTTLTPSSAKENIRLLKSITSKPVKYVINTHWHDDHIMGNSAYREAFPGVEFIAHTNTRTYLPTTGLSNRKQAMSEQGYPQFIKALKSRLEKNESVSGGPMNDEERVTYTSDVQIAESYMAENPGVEIVLPTTTVADKLTLQRGRRTIEILHLGRGHTSGDLVVFLPREKLVVAGDLVVWPVPYVGTPQSHPSDWSTTLRKMIALKPKVVIPGHGPVLKNSTYITQLSDLFSSISEQVEAGKSRGETLDQIRKSVRLDEFQKQFAGESRMRQLIFRNYVMGPAIEAAYLDSTSRN
jgi:cyclase